MTDALMIDGWRCYVSGDGLRVARSPLGEGVSVTKDGDLACDDTYVPATVVRWLMASADPEDERARYAAISGLRLAFLRHDRGDIFAIRSAFQALPCPQCRQTGWAHKMDCSQGDLERQASHPRGRVHIAAPDSLTRYGTGQEPVDPELALTQREQLLAWEALMRWSCDTIKGERYKLVSVNCNPNDPRPILIAEWGMEPRPPEPGRAGYDDGAMAVAGEGKTYGEAAYKLACMLGIQ